MIRTVILQYVQTRLNFPRDQGESLCFHRPAMQLLLERIPVTLFLVENGTTLSLVNSLPLSAWAVLRPTSLPSRLFWRLETRC